MIHLKIRNFGHEKPSFLPSLFNQAKCMLQTSSKLFRLEIFEKIRLPRVYRAENSFENYSCQILEKNGEIFTKPFFFLFFLSSPSFFFFFLPFSVSLFSRNSLYFSLSSSCTDGAKNKPFVSLFPFIGPNHSY